MLKILFCLDKLGQTKTFLKRRSVWNIKNL